MTGEIIPVGQNRKHVSGEVVYPGHQFGDPEIRGNRMGMGILARYLYNLFDWSGGYSEGDESSKKTEPDWKPKGIRMDLSPGTFEEKCRKEGFLSGPAPVANFESSVVKPVSRSAKGLLSHHAPHIVSGGPTLEEVRKAAKLMSSGREPESRPDGGFLRAGLVAIGGGMAVSMAFVLLVNGGKDTDESGPNQFVEATVAPIETANIASIEVTKTPVAILAVERSENQEEVNEDEVPLIATTRDDKKTFIGIFAGVEAPYDACPKPYAGKKGKPSCSLYCAKEKNKKIVWQGKAPKGPVWVSNSCFSTNK